MITNTRGSEWRKWDLHIHTPASIVNNYGGNSEEIWNKFIDALENLPEDVKVIGITDYYFIDGYEKVMHYRTQGRLKNIDKIFPILEFRIDTFGSGHENNLQKVNLHILFDLNETDLKNEICRIKSEFIGIIPLSDLEEHSTKMLSIENLIKAGGSLQSGFSTVIPSTNKVFEIINSQAWRNKTFTFIGHKEWNNLEKNQQLKPIKQDLYNKVGAFFSANYTSVSKHQALLNQYFNDNKRLLHSGDIHDFEKLPSIQSDGLIDSSNYCCNTWIKADPTFQGLKQIIYEPTERVMIQEERPERKSSYQLIESVTFDNENMGKQKLLFNQNLNTIIGGRSSGKSILLGCIAKKAGFDEDIKANNEYNKFITSEIFPGFEINWMDKNDDPKRKLSYFQQSKIISLSKGSKEINEIIEKIICLDANISHSLKLYETTVTSTKAQIYQHITDFISLSQKSSDLKKTKESYGSKKGIQDEINQITEQIDILKESAKSSITETEKNLFNDLQEKRKEISQRKAAYLNDIQNLTAIKENAFTSAINDSLKSISLEKLRNYLSTELASILTTANNNWRNFVEQTEATMNQDLKNMTSEDSNITQDVTYIKCYEFYSKNNQYKKLDESLKNEQKKLQSIEAIEKEIEATDSLRWEKINSAVSHHNNFYTNLFSTISKISLEKDDVKIKANVLFDLELFSSNITDNFNLRSGDGKNYLDINLTNDNYNGYDQIIAEIVRKILKKEIILKNH
ncbi:hypothetical protein [Acetobacterium woodii]|uniref:ATPase involved in DNA repair n=1 Tax=Acetobacterium woodii (strain ATCC 29683 / DSM 1030 / JCM 2381 / KCTC 1655 / WB1) TaxID=931626 RepID=H6LDK8_ACEWD|nr:hypothetical protein [Acetobacterium woodii]AFA47980.1 hypothetical protein Awo_c11960 [Acetobacterium woodii DSM 1030]